MSRSSTGIRFLQSTAASYVSLAIRLVIRFASRMVLARLIVPEGHGLYELALRIVIVASAVRDLGLNFHLMRDRSKPYGTVLAFCASQGLAVTLLVVLAAPLTAALDPALPGVLRLFALWVLLDGLVVVPRTYFERELRIGRVAVPEIWRGVAMAAVSVGLAWLGWGVWSLVVGDLVAAALFAALVWRRAWGKMPLAVDWSLVPGLLRQSRWLFSIWVVLQLVEYVDIFIVGAVTLDTAMVGQYSKAYEIAFLVPLIVAPRALLPALVEVEDDGDQFLTAFRLGTLFLMSFQVVAGYFLFLNADLFVRLYLGSQWDPAVDLLRILCFVPFLDVFKDLGGEVLKVKRQDRAWLAVGLTNLLSLVTFGAVFTALWGAQGMAAANFLLLGNWLMARRMARIFGPGFWLLARDLVVVYLLPLPLFALAAWALPADSWSLLIASAGAAGASIGLLAWRFWKPFRGFFA